MTDGGEDTAEAVEIIHLFDAPIAEVFKAWTDPEELAAWYGPEGMRTLRESIRIDARKGGRFELTMVSLDGGREFSLGYTILEIVPPQLLIMKSDPMPHDGGEPMTVSVQLSSLGSQTRMTLTDGPMPGGREHAEAGYRAAFAKLEAHLAS